EKIAERCGTGAAERRDLVRDRRHPGRSLRFLCADRSRDRGRFLRGGGLLRSRRLLRRGLLLARRLLLRGLRGGALRARCGLDRTRFGLGLGVAVFRLVHVEIELGAAPPATDRLRALDEQRPVDRTARLLQRLVVHREVALGIAVAAVEDAETRALLDDVALVALRTRDLERPRRVLLDVAAIRE